MRRLPAQLAVSCRQRKTVIRVQWRQLKQNDSSHPRAARSGCCRGYCHWLQSEATEEVNAALLNFGSSAAFALIRVGQETRQRSIVSSTRNMPVYGVRSPPPSGAVPHRGTSASQQCRAAQRKPVVLLSRCLSTSVRRLAPWPPLPTWSRSAPKFLQRAQHRL